MADAIASSRLFDAALGCIDNAPLRSGQFQAQFRVPTIRVIDGQDVGRLQPFEQDFVLNQ
jgi:hypothetical protein